MTELMILVLVVSAIIAGLCVAEQRGDSESAKEIKAICKRQRKEALKTARKYPHTAAGYYGETEAEIVRY